MGNDTGASSWVTWTTSFWPTITFAQAVEDEIHSSTQKPDEQTWTQYLQSYVNSTALEVVEKVIEEEVEQQLAMAPQAEEQAVEEQAVEEQAAEQRFWLDVTNLLRQTGRVYDQAHPILQWASSQYTPCCLLPTHAST